MVAHWKTALERTTLVMSLLPTCSLTRVLFTKGFDGSGMGMMSGIIVNRPSRRNNSPDQLLGPKGHELQ
jgi:hypothetical protein